MSYPRSAATALRMAALIALVLVLSVSTGAFGLDIVDLDTVDPVVLPDTIGYADTPFYITNTSPDQNIGEAEADSLTVDKHASLHLGYEPTAIATGDIILDVLGDITVVGDVRLGKEYGEGPGMPLAATNQDISLMIAGNLTLAGGVILATTTSADAVVAITVGEHFSLDGGNMVLQGAGGLNQATLGASTVTILNGTLRLGAFATLTTTAETTLDVPSLRVASGGVLLLGGGTPPLDPTEIWDFRGVNLITGGTGMLVERGGILRAGLSGGYIQGAAGERLEIADGGSLDTADGDIAAYNFDDIYLGGSYRAGYNQFTASVNRLDATASTVTLAATSRLGMTRTLQRAINRLTVTDIGSTAILRGSDVVFESGEIPILQTGMGVYHLALGQDDLDGKTSLWVERVVGGVYGDGRDEDRALFRSNMQDLWSPGGMNTQQADNIYNLTVAEQPSVFAVNEAGEFNKAILEAFVDGRDMPALEQGIADSGVFEFYNGSTAFGTNTVAYNTASEVVAAIGRRLKDIEGELAAADSSDTAFAYYHGGSLYRNNRFWVGGFGRHEDAELDYGIAGYKYKPSGFALGYDRVFGSLAVGGALTYGRGKYEDKAASTNDSRITSYSASAYGSYHHWSGVGVSAFASYSHLDNDIRDIRGGLRRKTDHDSYVWSLGAKIGHEIRPADCFSFTPSIGLTKIRAVNKAHSERLNDLTVIHFGQIHRDSFLMPVDLALDFDLYRGSASLLQLNANLGYAYDFDDGGILGDIYYDGLQGATAMPVAKREAGRHRFNFGAGVFWSGTRLDFTARYDYFRRSNEDAHQVRGNLGVKF